MERPEGKWEQKRTKATSNNIHIRTYVNTRTHGSLCEMKEDRHHDTTTDTNNTTRTHERGAHTRAADSDIDGGATETWR